MSEDDCRVLRSRRLVSKPPEKEEVIRRTEADRPFRNMTNGRNQIIVYRPKNDCYSPMFV